MRFEIRGLISPGVSVAAGRLLPCHDLGSPEVLGPGAAVPAWLGRSDLPTAIALAAIYYGFSTAPKENYLGCFFPCFWPSSAGDGRLALPFPSSPAHARLPLPSLACSRLLLPRNIPPFNPAPFLLPRHSHFDTFSSCFAISLSHTHALIFFSLYLTFLMLLLIALPFSPTFSTLSLSLTSLVRFYSRDLINHVKAKDTRSFNQARTWTCLLRLAQVRTAVMQTLPKRERLVSISDPVTQVCCRRC